MCFSAGASFGASAALSTIGVITISKTKTNFQKPFAAIPLIFAVQQLSEGILWLSLKDAGLAEWQSLLTYIYLAFAMAVWPLWVPLSIRLLEKNAKHKKMMNMLLAAGALVAICVCLILCTYPVKVMPMKHHLHYEFEFSESAKNLIVPFTVVYITATVVTPFVSRIKKMKWLGIAFLASYLFAVIFYNGFVLSVWCFFAALLSFVVLWIITGLRKL
jgi:Family of unknown function (DUF6629)